MIVVTVTDYNENSRLIDFYALTCQTPKEALMCQVSIMFFSVDTPGGALT